MIENWEGMEKWNDKRDFSFPSYYLIDQEDEKVDEWKTYLFS